MGAQVAWSHIEQSLSSEGLEDNDQEYSSRKY